jgi:hypothetical protein
VGEASFLTGQQERNEAYAVQMEIFLARAFYYGNSDRDEMNM